MSLMISSNQGNKPFIKCLFLGLIWMTINIRITHTGLIEPALGGEQIDEQSSLMMRPKSDENRTLNALNTHRIQEIQVPPLNNNNNNSKNLTPQQQQAQGAILRPSHSQQKQQQQQQQPRQSSLTSGSTTTTTTSAASNLLAVRQHWRQMEKSLGITFESTGDQLKLQLKELLASAAASATNSSAPTNSTSIISSGCRLALIEVADRIRDGSLWANQMLDASAKLPSGLLDGTLTEIGNFDGCLSIKSSTSTASSSSSSGSIIVQGQYCTISIKPHLIARPRLHTACQRLPSLSATTSSQSDKGFLMLKNNGSLFKWMSQNSHQFYYASLRLGICTPQKCSRNDLQLLLNNFLNKYELVGQVKSCQVSSASSLAASSIGSNYFINIQQFDFNQRIIIFALLALIGLSVIGTLVDCLHSTPSKQDERKQTNFQMEQQQQLLLQQKQKQLPKRWQYQVYNSLNKCQDCTHSALANNLALWTNSSGLIVGQTKEDPLLSCPKATTRQQVELEYDCCHANSHGNNFVRADDEVDDDDDNNDDDVDENGNEETKDESWIVKLEQNQLQQNERDNSLNHHHHPNQNQHQHQHQHQQPQEKTANDKKTETHQAPNCAPSILGRLMRCFSLKQNLKTISKQVQTASTTTKSNDSNDRSREIQTEDIKVIHGLRTLTMIWIIFGHTIGLVNPEMMNNLFALAQLSCSSRFLQAILNATLAVNTFFMISGVVTMISLSRRCKSASKLLQPTKTADGTAIASEKKPDDEDNHHDAIIRHNNQESKRRCCSSSEKSGIGNLTTSHCSSICGCGGGGGRGRGGGSGDIQIEADCCEDFISIASSSQSSGVSSSRRCIHNNNNNHLKTNQHQLEPAIGKSLKVNENNQKSQIETNILGIPTDFKPILWLLMRYLRLTPAYAAVIGLSILMPALGDGPFWLETAGQLGSACKQNWHLNLLYLNNLFETDKLCLIHSWYLSNDWQFFLLTLTLICLAYKSKKLAILLAISLGLASMATTFAQTVVNEFPPTIVTTSPAVAERWQFIHQLYYKPWPHLNSYLIGLLVGHLILRPSTTKNRRPGGGGGGGSYELPNKWRLSCLGLLVTCLAALLLSSIYPWNMGHRVDPILTGLHAATFRTLWSICCGWLLFVLAKQPQLLLSKFLSWPGFQLTSRLTYCTYLIHPLIIYYHFGTLRERIDSSMYSQFNRFLATLAQSYLFALILSLFVESPSIQLQHLLASLSSTSSSSSDQQNQDANGKNITTNIRNSSKKPHRRHIESLSSNSTADSWLVHGSSGNGSGDGGGGISATGGNTHSPLMMVINPGSQSLPPTTIDTSVDYNNSQPTTNSALDAEFQKKLAQAISKGFRIRSRMANGRSTNCRNNNSNNKLQRPTSILKPPTNPLPALHIEPTSLGLIHNPLQKLQLSQQQYLENNQSPMITNRRMHSTESLATFQPNPHQSHLPPIPGRPKQQLDHQQRRSSSDELAKSGVFDKQTKPLADIDSTINNNNNNNTNCNLNDLIQLRRKFLSQRSHSSNLYL